MIALTVNIALAVLWIILIGKPTFPFLLLGYLIGFVLIALFSKVLGGKDYVRRTLGASRFALHFLGLFIKANIEVAKLVLFVPNQRITSGFVDYDIEEMTFGEAILLSHCITLTPGTISADFNWEKRRLRIHVLDCDSEEEVINDIDRNIKTQIWNFTR